VPGDAHYSHEGEALREENAALVEENVSLRDAHAALHAEHAALRAEHAALTERFDAMAHTMESLRVRVLEASEPQLVELAMAVAGRVVGRELQTDPTLVASWAREAVELFVTREGLVVSVAPDLASLVPPEAWANALATPHTLVVDPSRAPGSASVQAGAAEAGVGVVERMASVREALTEGVE
jgi:flagellar biosynthesis/type III secretory pathway protein FliH